MGCGMTKNKGDDKETEIPKIDNACIDEEFHVELKGEDIKFNKNSRVPEWIHRSQRTTYNKLVHDTRDGKPKKRTVGGERWANYIMAPTTQWKLNRHPTCERFELEHVYGYRCDDVRQNCQYNVKGDIVYMAATLGIILGKQSNTQRFFGGGPKEDEEGRPIKQHTEDITALAISSDRKLVATGQIAHDYPLIYIWNSITGEHEKGFALPKDTKGVNALSFNPEGSHLAAVDMVQYVYLFGIQGAVRGQLTLKMKAGCHRVFHIEWSKKPGDMRFVTVGVHYVKFWYPKDKASTGRGLFKEKAKLTTYSSADFDEKGISYLGGMNGLLYVFGANSVLIDTHPVGTGPIHTLKYIDRVLITGSMDKQVRVHSVNIRCELVKLNKDDEKPVEVYSSELTELLSFDCKAIPRSIDKLGENYLIGANDGSIKEYTKSGGMTVFMEGHCKGEVWGLDIYGSKMHTVGDDNRLLVWNFERRRLTSRAILNKKGEKMVKKAQCTGLTQKHPNKCGRCVAYSKHRDFIAVGLNNGNVQIREGSGKLDIKHLLLDSQDWIEVMEYSPDGSFLAVGSHDSNIYIHNARGDYELTATCSTHKSAVISLDWSKDGKCIRSNCEGHELLFFDPVTGGVNPKGSKDTKDTDWATQNCKFAWNSQGIFEEGEAHYVNGVCISPGDDLIASAVDWGIVNIFRNPCLKGHMPYTLNRAHSQNVTRVQFSANGQYLFSVGGHDKTIMQWKQVDPLVIWKRPETVLIESTKQKFVIAVKLASDEIMFFDKDLKVISSLQLPPNGTNSGSIIYQLNYRTLLDCGGDFLLFINTRTSEVTKHEKGYTGCKMVGILPNGTFAISNSNELDLLSESGRYIKCINENTLTADLTCMLWIDETNELWGGDEMGYIYIWHVETGKENKIEIRSDSSKVNRKVASMALVARRSLVITIGEYPSKLKLFKLDGTIMYTVDTGAYMWTNLAVSIDHQVVLGDHVGHISLWDTNTRYQMTIFQPPSSNLLLMNSIIRVRHAIFLFPGESDLKIINPLKSKIMQEQDTSSNITGITKFYIQ